MRAVMEVQMKSTHNENDVMAGVDGNVSRRRFGVLLGQVSALIAAASVLPANAWAQAGKFAGTTLVYVGWGGIYQESQKVGFCDPFAKETGVTIVQDGPVDYAKLRIMVQNGNPTWDVVDVEGSFFAIGVREGLFEKIDRSVIDVSTLTDEFVHDNGVGAIVWSYNLGYSLDTYNEQNRPRSWTDLFDVQKFPGRRALRDRPNPSLELALLADGVPPDQLYPLDVDRAFRKLDTIRNDTIFYATNSQAQQLLTDGEANMVVMPHGRIFDLVKKGVNVGIEWNQSLQAADYLVVLKGSKNVPAAMGLLNEMTKPSAQVVVAQKMAGSPVNPATFELIDEQTKPWLPTFPANQEKAIMINETYWSDNLQMLNERWTKWKLG
jgi:putative spermidine/putrescine transport system substrate-binding protein